MANLDPSRISARVRLRPLGLWACLLLPVVPIAAAACVGDDPTTTPNEADAAGGGEKDAAANDARSPSNAPPGAPASVNAAAVPVVRTVSTLAGQTAGGFADGNGAAAKLFEPSGVAVDALGVVYVADKANHRIRKISVTGDVTTLAGTGATAFADGNPGIGTFFLPIAIAVHTSGVVYVGDSGNNRIRMVSIAGQVTTLAGAATGDFADGNGGAARFFGPSGVALDSTANVYVSDTINQRIRFVSPAGQVVTLAGTGSADFVNGAGTVAAFKYPSGVAVANGTALVADASNQRIRKVTSGGQVSTFAGSGLSTPFADGVGAAATFSAPQGVALDTGGNAYVADQGNHRIRKITPAGVVTTFAGSGQGAFGDGPSETASFNSPYGVAVSAALDVYVADVNNHRIRKITSVGIRQLTVKWNAPASSGSSAITAYEATAAAAGQTSQTCKTTGELTCVIKGLASDIAYSVTVTASNAAGTSDSSVASIATPN